MPMQTSLLQPLVSSGALPQSQFLLKRCSQLQIRRSDRGHERGCRWKLRGHRCRGSHHNIQRRHHCWHIQPAWYNRNNCKHALLEQPDHLYDILFVDEGAVVISEDDDILVGAPEDSDFYVNGMGGVLICKDGEIHPKQTRLGGVL